LGTLDFTRASEEYERALALAPDNAQILRLSGLFATYMGRTDTGLAAARRALVLDPSTKAFYTKRGFAYYGLKDFERARASCENAREYSGNQWCLSVTYDKLGRHSDAEAELSKLKIEQKLKFPL
jgi:tetratricopeptide (TPR) repeat protein